MKRVFRRFVLLIALAGSALAQNAPTYIFVSPNTAEQLSLPKALAGLKSRDEQRMLQATRYVLCRTGAEGTATPALGVWVDGTENSVVLRTKMDEAGANYAGSWMAQFGRQKATLVFQEREGGTDRLYTLRFAARDVAAVIANLEKHRLVDMTIISGAKEMTVLVSASEQDRAHVEEAARELKATLTVSRGTSRLLGDSFDRQKGLEKLSGIVAEYEKRHPDSGGCRLPSR